MCVCVRACVCVSVGGGREGVYYRERGCVALMYSSCVVCVVALCAGPIS